MENGNVVVEDMNRTTNGAHTPARNTRYVLRNGITVAIEENDAGETTVKAVPIDESMEPVSNDPMWNRLPRHIQLLASIPVPVEEEVAQKYYKRGFDETRQQLIERLLNPTLTLEETARVLGVCPATVRRYTNRGVLPHFRTVGQQRRFRLSDVLSFMEQGSRRGRYEDEDIETNGESAAD
ncbi:MAG: helix-turn-helix domain-containing protein [Capsulimonadales bacterium]|nr:helix-turn-helix domain-containing protein [Capsulimonadales bacterium]